MFSADVFGDSLAFVCKWYILADQILGEKFIFLPPLGTTLDRTYSELVKDEINQMRNAQVQLENAFPFSVPGSSTGRIFEKAP